MSQQKRKRHLYRKLVKRGVPQRQAAKTVFANYKQQAFIDFVLSQYIKEGVQELDRAKLPNLLELKYHAVSDAAAELGDVSTIRDMFVGFQKYLYQESNT